MGRQATLICHLSSFIRCIERQSPLQHYARLNIGVCVSGGPDSMALAYLLKQLQSSGTHRIQLSAWIVDHRARSNSTAEANTVQDNLRAIGIPSSILRMQWPDHIVPLRLSDFESQARSMRYELLTKAAVKNDIRHLFLGHHQDDQVETVLMRLIRNQNTSLRGLTGMAATLNLPVTHDVPHIMSEPDKRHTGSSLPMKRRREPDKQLLTATSLSVAKSMEVLLQRPFLHFPKTALVETCEQNNVPYVIDQTNKDPQTNLRNAVRYLRLRYTLPAALDEKRILKLRSTAQDHIRHVKSDGEEVLDNCKVLAFDTRSGVIKAYLPIKQICGSDRIDAYSYAVWKLMGLVAPATPGSPMARLPLHILSHLADNTGESLIQLSIPSFTFGKVQFTPCKDEPQTWILSRQSLTSTETVANSRLFSWKDNSPANSSDDYASNFLLWDNRFWVKVSVASVDFSARDELRIRPLTRGDMTSVKHVLKLELKSGNDARKSDLIRVLREAAPDKIRYTLPVLTFWNQVVAFPTLQYRLDYTLKETGLEKLEWNIYYKAVKLPKSTPG